MQFVGGIAVGESNQLPLAGLMVRLLRLRLVGDSVRVVDSARTDSQGTFLFNARQLGIYQIEFGTALEGFFYGPVDTLTTDSVVQRRYLVGLARFPQERASPEYGEYRPIKARRPYIQAEYPVELRKRGIQGTVRAEFAVDTSGRVDMSSVALHGEVARDFSESVKAALAKMRFDPFPAFPPPVRPPDPALPRSTPFTDDTSSPPR